MLTGQRLLLGGGALALGLWAFIGLQTARRTADKRRAIVGTILWLAGLETAITQVLTPRVRVDDPTAVTSALSATVSHYMALSCLLLAVLGTIYGAVQRGVQATPVLLAVWMFSLGPLVASLAGTVPYWTKGLLFLPLTATAIAFNADVTHDLPWLLTQLRWITRIYTYGSIVAFILATHWATYPPPPNSEARAWFGISQVAGLTPHPNSLGPIGALAALLEFTVIARSPRWRWHVGAGVLTVAMAESRSGFLMLIVGILFLHAAPAGRAILRGWVGRFTYVGMLIALLAALATSDSRGPLTSQLSLTHLNTFLNGRTSVWQFAWAEFQRNRLFGYGPGLFGTAYRTFLPAQLQFAGEAHNELLQTLGEAGLIGLAGLMTYVVLISRAAAKCATKTAGLGPALVASLFVRMTVETPLRDYGVNIGLFSQLVVLAVLIYGGTRTTGKAEQPTAKAPGTALALAA